MGQETDMDEGQRVAEEAAGWIARLDSQDCSQTEREAFERWRDADPLHAMAYRHAQDMWRDSNAVIRNSMALSEAARHALQDSRERSARRWWLPAASFAAVAVIALAGFLYWPLLSEESGPPVGAQYATAVGEQRSITLADGSTLTLDTQTVLVERYTRGRRRVDLLQGRAQFEVQGDPSRPFVVHAPGGTITAIGTRFQVSVADAGATVTLLKGQVHVAAHPEGGQERVASLQPGQMLRFDADGTLGDVQIANLKAAQGWTDGKLYVDNWRLQDFVVELNRYGGPQLRIDDPALRDLRISGVFQTRNRDNVSRLLAQGWDIQSRKLASDEVLLTHQ